MTQAATDRTMIEALEVLVVAQKANIRALEMLIAAQKAALSLSHQDRDVIQLHQADEGN